MTAAIERLWDPETDDVLALHREVGMEIHRPVEFASRIPVCGAPGEFWPFGRWVMRMEVGHECSKCFPRGWDR